MQYCEFNNRTENRAKTRAFVLEIGIKAENGKF